jgi:hypothetical protein
MGDVSFVRFKKNHPRGAALIQQTARCIAPSVQHKVHQLIFPQCQRLDQTFS